jgi:hypothetical protein
MLGSALESEKLSFCVSKRILTTLSTKYAGAYLDRKKLIRA